MKPCERCKSAVALSGERYCKGCRKVVLDELRESYLTKISRSRQCARPYEAQEKTYETKYGLDY